MKPTTSDSATLLPPQPPPPQLPGEGDGRSLRREDTIRHMYSGCTKAVGPSDSEAVIDPNVVEVSQKWKDLMSRGGEVCEQDVSDLNRYLCTHGKSKISLSEYIVYYGMWYNMKICVYQDTKTTTFTVTKC